MNNWSHFRVVLLSNKYANNLIMRLFISVPWASLFILILNFSVSWANPHNPNETLQLSLEEAREYAAEHSFGMRKARADLRIAEEQIWETTAAGLPQVNASVGYNYYLDIPTSLVPAEFFGGEPGEFAEIQFGTEQNVTATASVEQLIFDGQYIVGLRASRIFRDLANQTLQRSEAEIKQSVTETYLLVLLARENLGMVRQNLGNMEQQLHETREMLREGFTDPINVDQLQLTVSNMENRIAALERQHEVTSKLLKFQLGLDMDQNLELTDKLEDLHGVLLSDLGAATAFSPRNHIDYRITQSQESMSLMTLRREQSAYLPSLSASFTRQEMAMRDEFNFFDGDQSWFPSTYFGVNLTIPIFSSGMRASRVQQARLELEKSRTAREEVYHFLDLQMQEAMADYHTAMEQYANEQDNLDLAARIFERTTTMFREGMASSLELTQANDQMITTRANYYQALFEVLNAENNMLRALGQ